jgi:hypothetical protein
MVAKIYSDFKRAHAATVVPSALQSTLCDVNIRPPLTPRDIEILSSFSILLQSFLLSHATPEQRREMGVPDGLLDDEHIAKSVDIDRESSWWLAPFEGIDLIHYSSSLFDQCTGLKRLIATLHAATRVELSWQDADTINREILTALESGGS